MKRLLLIALSAFVALSASAQMKISGTLRDTNGKGIAGVTVSDGFSCVTTDSKGRYKMTTSSDAMHVFYSIPSGYKVSVKDGHPDFYQLLDSKTKRYDFTLAANDKPEKAFRLLMVADPQAQCEFHIKRFERETVPDIRAYVDSQTLPCYGVTLGDVVYTEGPHKCNKYMEPMRRAMGYDNTHLLFFQTIGNHDFNDHPVTLDKGTSTYNLAYQRAFEKVFGPVNYSWNRGDVHIVSMKDYIADDNPKKFRYHKEYGNPCFTDEQLEWLRQDLAAVPKDKMVILCLHIGLYNRMRKNVDAVRQLVAQFKEAHIMIGHTHFMNHSVNKDGVFEHVHAAASGAFWWSCLNGDGAPNGYAIYDIDGAHIKNWWYKSIGYDISYQIRMYRGDAKFGGEFETFQFPYSHDTVLANVFNADPAWEVLLYEDGVLTGKMERIPTTRDSVPEADSSRDWYAVGYHIGVVGRSYGKVDGVSAWKGGGRKGYLTQCNHLYRLKLNNPNAKEIKVVAKDTNGNVYSQTRFTESFDYSECELTNKLLSTPREELNKNY
ncbi:MAG: calcineurin-like phosphoesterase C-terminal domain-containing protein [Alistipes sp.]|nr:calcineurin-like phosphoesterase C-terminal domain-containing protein [Alistipes sp.]